MGNKKKILFHIDMDAFFASVEIAINKNLAGKPLIIGGLPEKRGVVSTCNYEARAYGVRSAMSSWKALQLCPQARFLTGNHKLYKKISDHVMEILYTFTPLVEKVSIDEAYLDMTDAIAEDKAAIEMAKRIKETIFSKLKLTCSIGIAPNKMIAKMLSSIYKPNGLKQIRKGEEIPFLRPLGVDKIPGIGPKTVLKLKHHQIETIDHLMQKEMGWLIDHFGSRGYFFYKAARGQASDTVRLKKNAAKSIGKETTFTKDTADVHYLLQCLQNLTYSSCERMQKKGMRCCLVSIKLRFDDFTTITRSVTLPNSTQNKDVILNAVHSLFKTYYKERKPLRLLGVTLEKLIDGYWQPTFWDN